MASIANVATNGYHHHSLRLPPGGSLSLKHILPFSFICFLRIGIAYLEPRHYGGVFVIQ